MKRLLGWLFLALFAISTIVFKLTEAWTDFVMMTNLAVFLVPIILLALPILLVIGYLGGALGHYFPTKRRKRD